MRFLIKNGGDAGKRRRMMSRNWTCVYLAARNFEYPLRDEKRGIFELKGERMSVPDQKMVFL